MSNAIDPNDPGYQRSCARPDCKASFNALHQMTSEYGGTPVRGWVEVTMFAGGRLCDQHAPPVLNGGHAPSWIWTGEYERVVGTRCSCGWTWQPEGLATNGQHHEQWLAHLVTAVPGTTTNGGTQ